MVRSVSLRDRRFVFQAPRALIGLWRNEGGPVIAKREKESCKKTLKTKLYQKNLKRKAEAERQAAVETTSLSSPATATELDVRSTTF